MMSPVSDQFTNNAEIPVYINSKYQKKGQWVDNKACRQASLLSFPFLEKALLEKDSKCNNVSFF